MGEVEKRAEGLTFLFFTFLLYLCFLFLRPMELFAPWMAEFRPMLIIWVIAFGGSFLQALGTKNVAATATHYGVLIMLWVAILASLLRQGQFGLAVSAVSDFSTSALLFMLISFNLVTLQRLRTAGLVILVSLFILSLAGISAFHLGYKNEELIFLQRKDWTVELPEARPPIPSQDTSGAYMYRVRGVGFLNDPNDFAQALIMALPMLWWLVRKGAWMRNLLLVGLPGAAMVYCVTLTNSRGAILGMGSLLFFGVRNKLGNVKTGLLLGMAVGGAMVLGMTGGREMSTKDRSAEERIEAWYEGFQMLKSSPLFGIGYGQFSERYYITAHNSFVLGFSELGLFGYFFWIALLVLGFTTAGRVAKYAPPGTPENLAGNILRSSLVGYVTCAWFLSRTYQPVLYCLLALCTAVWVCACRSPACANIEPLHAPLKVFKKTCAMVFLSFVAIYLFIFLNGGK